MHYTVFVRVEFPTIKSMTYRLTPSNTFSSLYHFLSSSVSSECPRKDSQATETPRKEETPLVTLREEEESEIKTLKDPVGKTIDPPKDHDSPSEDVFPPSEEESPVSDKSSTPPPPPDRPPPEESEPSEKSELEESEKDQMCRQQHESSCRLTDQVSSDECDLQDHVLSNLTPPVPGRVTFESEVVVVGETEEVVNQVETKDQVEGQVVLLIESQPADVVINLGVEEEISTV